MNMPTTLTDVVCCGCSCLCDDLQVDVDGGRVANVTPNCLRGQRYFSLSEQGAQCRIDGEEASLTQGISAATELLAAAKAPLLLGLGELTIDAQRAALDWADKLGAYVDAGNPAEPDPSGMVLQSTGLITATLGEIRDRADVVLYWNADPQLTHPRYRERFALGVAGKFFAGSRTSLVIDQTVTATSLRADSYFESPITDNLEVAQTLLALGRGKCQNPPPKLLRIHQKLAAANYAAIVCGPEFFGGDDGAAVLETLADYVRELNQTNRAIVSLLKSGPNWVGAAETIAWRTGYPSPVRFAADGPEYEPTSFRAAKLLARGQVDAVIRFDGDWLRKAPPEMLTALAKLPTIAFGHDDLDLPAKVAFRVAKPGVECGGSMHRLDDVPLPLTAVLSTERQSTETIIRQIIG
ncbi:molybdopterin-binding domain-containing protein [Blastopirellula retiformator]|uniref:hypothetical protein n=1 Tax=Blastopirellula retiformator TaxID=2527970 RepID=UPI0011B732E2|nr:hypothetical protein [Blastopirellula retiformator]